MESEMTLEWALKQPTGNTTTTIDLDFLPRCANQWRRDQHLDFNSRRELNAGSLLSKYEKMLENWMNDEIKRAGLEALVPEELEKHLMLNSNRLRTFEDASLEIVTYVETKFGLRIRCFEPSDASFRECSDPMGVGAVRSLSLGKKKKVIRSTQWGFTFDAAHLQRDCNASKNTGKQTSGRSKQSKSWSKSEGKGKWPRRRGKIQRKVQKNQRCNPRRHRLRQGKT